MLRLASLAAALLVVGTTAAAAVVAADGDRVTICHKADSHPRTMEVASSSWQGHQAHGDHKGACTSSDLSGGASGSGTSTSRPASPLALQAEGEGDLDGDARFRVVVDHDANDAHDVRVEGRLWGEGRWTVESGPGCAIAKDTLSCSFGVLAAGDDQVVRLRFDGPPVTVCREAGLELRLTAANDATSGDDAVKSEVRVGACAVGPWNEPL